MGLSSASVLELAAFIEEFGQLLMATAAGCPPPPRDAPPAAPAVANSPLAAIRAMRCWLTDDVCQMEESDLTLGFDFCLEVMQKISSESSRRQKVKMSAHRTSVRRTSQIEDKARKIIEDKQRKEAERAAHKANQAQAQATHEAEVQAEREAKEKAEREAKAEEGGQERTRAARSAESLRRRKALDADRAKFQQEHLSKKPNPTVGRAAKEHTDQDAHVSAIMAKYSEAKPAPAITSYKRGGGTGRGSMMGNEGAAGSVTAAANAEDGEKELKAKADREAASNAKRARDAATAAQKKTEAASAAAAAKAAAALDDKVKANAEKDASAADARAAMEKEARAKKEAAEDTAKAKAEKDAATADVKAAKDRDARVKKEAAEDKMKAKAEKDAATADAKVAHEKDARAKKEAADKAVKQEATKSTPEEAKTPSLVKLERVDHSKWQSEQQRLAASVNVGDAQARASALDFSFSFG